MRESVTVMRAGSTLALNISHFSTQTPDLENIKKNVLKNACHLHTRMLKHIL